MVISTTYWQPGRQLMDKKVTIIEAKEFFKKDAEDVSVAEAPLK